MHAVLLATRPKTLIASISPVLIGSALAYRTGHINWMIFALTLLTGMMIQISTNLANDLFDFLKGADTKDRTGPIRVTANGLLSVLQMRWFTTLAMALTITFASVLIARGGLPIAALTALALLLALGYTTGPLPLAYLGIAEIFILIFFGPVATGYTYYLQTLSLSPLAFAVGLGPGLLSCSLLIVNNLRDLHTDREAKKQTLVVRFGKQFGRIEFAVVTIGGALLPLFLLPFLPYAALSLVCLPIALILTWKVAQIDDPRSYGPLFVGIGRLLLLYTITFTVGALL